MKERLANDQGRASFIGSVKSWTESVNVGLSVLLAGKIICKFPSALKTKPLKALICLQYFYDCGAIEGSFARTKTSLSDFSFL